MDAESNSSSMSSSGDDSSTSSDGDDVGERERASADLKQRLSFVGTSIGLAVTIISGMYNMLEVCKGLLGTSRLPNVHRRRDHCADVIGSLSQEQFKSQTGLSRKIFNYLLQLIRPRVQGNRAMGAVSSGSHISSMMKLFIHQRLMKGAKSQDVEWMGTDPKHVWVHIWLPVATALDEVLDNVHFSNDPVSLRQMANEWSFVQRRKYNTTATYGLVAAGDGIVIKIGKPTKKELDKANIPLDRFWNRKGYYALNAQAFCDAWCRIVSFACLWPRSTPDIVAYGESAFYLQAMPEVPDEFYLALDEAYKSIHDGKHLTPFSGAEMRLAQNSGNEEAARMMRTFNKIFCSDRITIERTFGQLVRRWGILWGANPRTKFTEISLVLRVAVKLHNLCVDEFLCEKFGYESEAGRRGEAYPTPRVPTNLAAASAFENIGEQAPLPGGAQDVAELADELLLTRRSDLRTDENVELREELARDPDDAYTDDPTRNAGIAMMNIRRPGADETPSTVQRSYRDVLAALSPTTEAAVTAVEQRDRSAGRRLRMALGMRCDGLSYAGL
mmetsp:Transcript_1890/g.4409  ORF Transcript_1890/g.4409 Transcript_1890/m.4409 type:complete len:557 (-) Transcript_1890:2051-3721(-)